MEPKTETTPSDDGIPRPVARVTGLYRGTFAGLVPLTESTPLTQDQVRRYPVFYELDLNHAYANENLIIDLIYDNLSPIRLQDLYRGTDLPRGVRFWPDWFNIPPYDEMHDIDGRRVYPRAPGLHTVQIRAACRKLAQIGRSRDFSLENGGSTSPVFTFRIAEETNV
ncbi:hypothetical protein Mboo_0412 [Methanoregula boonei 6A8]|jgi:hypothetical protein|uniref:Uncharacterized protein n=1 Tax=Methanoregula boonei (strain DSM 21154 / JCM 14090 / 6A8) TaxID=456442 RepID=A7I5C1_METB6|nr:hypothetical protein [Methanoregula boonei]ABS54932.1 hypothetical protein Mboo_0412 [Methanoregula boonei 6A8]